MWSLGVYYYCPQCTAIYLNDLFEISITNTTLYEYVSTCNLINRYLLCQCWLQVINSFHKFVINCEKNFFLLNNYVENTFRYGYNVCKIWAMILPNILFENNLLIYLYK